MKTQVTTLIALLMLISTSMWADETITVTATQDEIAEQLDLKAVASVFGNAKNLEEFEKQINDEEQHISNLDLNGDGQVDYLRVIESAEGNKHLVIIQAVLAKDIFQDVASIYVERDEATNETTVQVVGDEYIYGTNYIIEPVYITTPVIYDWFWGPTWSVWYSPYYWGYYPHWWHPFHCWTYDTYWGHIHNWHYYHPYCSYRHPHDINPHFRNWQGRDHRRDFATRYPNKSFNTRHEGVRNVRSLQTSRNNNRVANREGALTNNNPTTRSSANPARQTTNSRTFNSAYTGRTTQLSGNTRTTASDRKVATTRSSSNPTRTSTPTHGTRSASVTHSTSAGSQRSTASTSTSRSASVTRNSGSASTTRSSSTSGVVRSSNSTSSATRSSGSYSSGSSRSSSSTSSATRSSGNYSSGSSRSSSSYSSGSRSSGGYSSGGGSRSGGSSGGGGSRSGGGRR